MYKCKIIFFQIASETLGWTLDESRFPLEGKLQFAQPSEANWKRPWTGKMSPVSATLAVLSSEELPEVTTSKELIFPQDTNCIKDAMLVLFKINSKPSLLRVRNDVTQ